jgi:hypothetical protein
VQCGLAIVIERIKVGSFPNLGQHAGRVALQYGLMQCWLIH